MIIARAPYRLSFFGGGTDYPTWSHVEGGSVLSTTIDKYCYVSVRHLPPFFSNRHRVVWSHVETVGAIAEILHPAVREGLRMLAFDDTCGLEIHHQGDLPARAGMGSSSSFAVAMILALSAFQGRMVGPHELALAAIELEQQRLREHVGSQDQVAAAYGGLNRIDFAPDGEIRVAPVTLAPERVQVLERRLMLFFTGTSRLSSEVAAEVVANLRERESALRRMRAMVDEALALLATDSDLDAFGALLDEGWRLKRSLASRVANETVDEVYRRALKAGALGGKLLGAGGSGFMVFYVPERRQPAVRRALENFLHVPFRFESEGGRVLHYGSRAPWLDAPESRRPLATRPARAPRPVRREDEDETGVRVRSVGSRS